MKRPRFLQYMPFLLLAAHAPAQQADVYGNLKIDVTQLPDSGQLAVQLDWPGADGTYYFLEQTPDLLRGFSTIKLFAGARADTGGKLSAGLETTAPMGFYRLFITDDESHPRLLADDDGDKISNFLEAQAGWDAYEQPADMTLDTDGDGMPDYWENFHFGNPDQDGAGDPDGDGILNHYEWQAATDPNVDETTQSALKDRFGYDDRGWLNYFQLMGSSSTGLDHDAEGNLTTGN